LFSSTEGLVAFHPRSLAEDPTVPPVVFTGFFLENRRSQIGGDSPLSQSIDLTHSISLTYADRMIAIEFAALNCRTPRETRYRYKLDGFDDDWIEVDSSQRLVTYTNLHPRRYLFRVKAASAHGAWNETERTIALIVTPPWWATWWFRGLALALTVGGAGALYTWRVNSLKRQRRALEAEIVERKQAEEALRSSHRHIQDLAGRLISAQEAERSRIARELHDDVNQHLVSLSMSLSSLKHRLPAAAAELPRVVTGIQEQAYRLSEEIRRVSHELHPAVLQHAGLVAALKRRCQECADQHGIDIRFRTEGDLERVSPQVGLCLYRIAQEALHNIARHAAARQVEVLLARGIDTLELRVRDDGQGFDLEEAQQRGGLGLISMHERVRLVQGTVQIDTAPRRGTDLRIRVPLSAESTSLGEFMDEPGESLTR
jgi:signal transduction histidine kinase